MGWEGQVTRIVLEEICIHGLGEETWGTETTWKTQEYMSG